MVRHFYQSQDSEQLTLHTGRIVEVIEKNNNGWWRGVIEEQVGWFPATYVRKIEGRYESMLDERYFADQNTYARPLYTEK